MVLHFFRLALMLAVLGQVSGLAAQNWQEPFVWQLDYSGLSLVKAKQRSYSLGKGPECELLEVVHGPAPHKRFQIQGFFALEACAGAADAPHPAPPFSQDTMYLLLRVDHPKRPLLPTPGTGMIPVSHRITAFGSLHSMFPMFAPEPFLISGLKAWLERDSVAMQSLLNPLWELPCSAPGGANDSLFYMQVLGLAWAGDLALPVPRRFLQQAWESAHVPMRWGGIWAAAGLSVKEREDFWQDGLMHPDWTDVEQFLAVHGLLRLGHPYPDSVKESVMFQRVSDRPTQLPLSVQDPRYCTRFASVKSLLALWKARKRE